MSSIISNNIISKPVRGSSHITLSVAWAYPGGGDTGGRLPLFEPREFFEILIITECFLNSQPSQN